MAVVLKRPVETDDQTRIEVSIQANLNVSAYVARRQVTGYMADNVSDHLGGQTPDLVIEGERLFWRVPIALYLTSRGKVGLVGTVDVDAQTGQLNITPDLIEDIEHRARQMAARPAP